MPHITDISGLAGVASAVVAMVFLPLMGIVRSSARLRKKLTKQHLALLMVAGFALMLIPFNDGMPLAAYVRGVTGDLSITTLFLLWCALLKPWFNSGITDSGVRYPLLMLIALVALAFYPMAMGASAFDPYRLGYGNPQFVSALLLIALAAWLWKFPLIALCIALATIAWSIGWYESDNIWDYLLDPFVSVYALAAVMFYVVKALWMRGRANELQPRIHK
jgi:hypothetical protein